MWRASVTEAGQQHARRNWERQVTVEVMARAEKAQAAGQSQVRFCKAFDIPRNTLRYWLERKAHLGGHPKVVNFFESPEGLAVLHQICMAAHFVIEFLPRTGIRGMCEFLELSGLSKFVASSYGAQQQVSAQMEAEIARYEERVQGRLAAQMAPRKITLCEDETFHPQICLVGIEPVSDFILVERYAEKRDAKTWDAQVSRGLGGLPVEVVQSTSDEGKGLLAHVREGLGAHHSPDLFHLQREIAKGLCPRLNAELRRARRAHEEAIEVSAAWKQAAELYAHYPELRGPGRPPNFPKRIGQAAQAQEQAHQALEQVKAEQQQVREALRGIAEAYHPFDLKTGQRRSVSRVERALKQQFAQLDQLAEMLGLDERGKAHIDKARRLIPKLLTTLAFVLSAIKALCGRIGLAGPRRAHALSTSHSWPLPAPGRRQGPHRRGTKSHSRCFTSPAGTVAGPEQSIDRLGAHRA